MTRCSQSCRWALSKRWLVREIWLHTAASPALRVSCGTESLQGCGGERTTGRDTASRCFGSQEKTEWEEAEQSRKRFVDVFMWRWIKTPPESVSGPRHGLCTKWVFLSACSLGWWSTRAEEQPAAPWGCQTPVRPFSSVPHSDFNPRGISCACCLLRHQAGHGRVHSSTDACRSWRRSGNGLPATNQQAELSEKT